MPDRPAPTRAWCAFPVALLVGAGCLLPVAVLMVFSVFRTEDVELVADFTLASWRELATSPAYRILIGKAALSGVLTATLTALAAYPLAIAMRGLDRVTKGLVLTALLTPLYTGEIVRLYAWRLVLGSEGLFNSFLLATGLSDAPVQALLFSPIATHLVLFYNNLPFMVLSLWVSTEMIDTRLIEASRDLGARPFQAFTEVILPLTRPGLAAGGFAVFALAAGDFLTPSLMGGASGGTVVAAIDGLFGTAFDWPLASALALTLLAVLCLAALLLSALAIRPVTRSRAP